MKAKRIMSLLWISVMMVTVTACAKTGAVVTSSSDTTQETATVKEADENMQEAKETTQTTISEKSDDKFEKEEPKKTKSKSSLLDPQLISFEENQFSNYLEETVQPENIVTRIFGFNAPDGYIMEDPSDVLLQLENLGEASYIAAADDGKGYLYIFDLNQPADIIRDYLKNDTWPELCDFSNGISYPMLLMGASVNNIEKEETLDTIYGGCDILFAELETDAYVMELLEAENPIYVEAAYFSLKTAVTDTSRITKDIAIMYLYSPEDASTNTYQGYLEKLFPDMITPINS